MIRFLRILAACFFVTLAPVPAMAADVTVFGAASLADALNEISAAYQKQTGKSVTVSLAASSAQSSLACAPSPPRPSELSKKRGKSWVRRLFFPISSRR